MKTLYLLMGLPGSGKDRWARQFMKESKTKIKRINKDDLRAMLDISEWSEKNEQFVLDTRNHLIRKSLMSGYDVIVSDTNFPVRGKHYQTICDIARQVGDVLIVEKFFDISLKDALLANKGPNRVAVPDDVIVHMFEKYVKGKNVTELIGDGKTYFPPVKYEYNIDPKLPMAIICDLDGTLAHMNGRNPYNPTDEEVMNDVADEAVMGILNSFMSNTRYFDGYPDEFTGVQIIFCSGRFDTYRTVTEQWILRNLDGNYFNKYGIKLLMRKDGDMRKDSIVKKEIYEREIKGKYNVLFVLDDRQSVVEMWRNEGLKALQVAWGDF